MIKANVILDHLSWKNKLTKPTNYITERLKKLSRLSQFKNKKQEFTIFLTNNYKIKKLNKKFRNKNKFTDVLSFPYFNKKDLEITKKKNIYIGDIAISYKAILERSKKENFLLEFDKVWIHGLLHLVGYDHVKNKDYYTMAKEEKRILSSV